MTKYILFMMLFICLLTNAQQKNTNQTQQNKTENLLKISQKIPTEILFDYDDEGNQIKRFFFVSIPHTSKIASSNEITEIKADNLELISSSEEITYYPNPVKDELYLQWESNQDNAVVTINLFDLNGQLLQSYSNSTNSNSLNISFINYPTGVYAVVLVYNNGNQKSIKIIKQ